MTHMYADPGPHRTEGRRRGFFPQGSPLWATYPNGATYLIVGWVILEAGGVPLYSVNAAPLAVSLSKPGGDAIPIDPGYSVTTTDPRESAPAGTNMAARYHNLVKRLSALADEIDRPHGPTNLSRRIRQELSR